MARGRGRKFHAAIRFPDDNDDDEDDVDDDDDADEIFLIN